MALVKDGQGNLAKRVAQDVAVGDQMLLLPPTGDSSSLSQDSSNYLDDFDSPMFQEVKSIREIVSEPKRMIELHTNNKQVIVSGVVASCESANDNQFMTQYVEPLASRISPTLMCKVHNLVKIAMSGKAVTWKETEFGSSSSTEV